MNENLISEIDELTGCKNRRYINRILESIHDKKIVVALLDIANFKRYNEYQYSYGDWILGESGKYISKFFEPYDVHICRYGGDEFIIISELHTLQQFKCILEDFEKKKRLYNRELVRIDYSVCECNAYDFKDIINTLHYKLMELKKLNKNKLTLKL